MDYIERQYLAFRMTNAWGSVLCPDLQRLVREWLMQDAELLQIMQCCQQPYGWCNTHKRCDYDCVLIYLKNGGSRIEVLVAAVNEWPYRLDVAPRIEELCLVVVQRDGNTLRYIKNQTPAICRAAVRQNPNARRFAKIQHFDLPGLHRAQKMYCFW